MFKNFFQVRKRDELIEYDFLSEQRTRSFGLVSGNAQQVHQRLEYLAEYQL